MKQLEKQIIDHMREAIAQYHTNPPLASKHFHQAHDLFAARLMRWEDSFAVLERDMYKLWCAYTPMPKGHYRTTSIGVGYSSYPVTRWVNEKVQPPIPTTDEVASSV